MFLKVACANLMFWAFFTSAIAQAAPNPVQTAPELKLLPPEKEPTTCSLVVVKIQTNGKKVIVRTETGVDQSLDTSGTKVNLVFSKPGLQKIWAVTSLNDDLVEAELVLDVKGSGPAPNPDPVVPDEKDPLVLSLKDLYSKSSATDKAKVTALVDALKEGARAANDANSKTNLDIVSAVQGKTATLGSSLSDVRKEIGKFLNANLPETKVDLTPEIRNNFNTTYTKVATALEKAVALADKK